jgi:hypothetical protein
MKNRIVFSLALPALAILLQVSCTHDAANPDFAANADCSQIDPAQNTYSNSIKAILDANCATADCHDAITRENGVNLSSYASAKDAFQNDVALCAIHHGSGCAPMPNEKPMLSAGIINQIDCWVRNGFLQ